jgi:ankyrin repeat protein
MIPPPEVKVNLSCKDLKVLVIIKYFRYAPVMRIATLLLISLLCLGCDPGVPVPPLCRAARDGDLAGIAELVRSGADVNERGGINDWTALMHAVHKNQPGAVRSLIDAGANVNAKAGARGRDTALRLAEIQDLREIAVILREHGARRAEE